MSKAEKVVQIDEKKEVKPEPPKDVNELLSCIQRKMKAPKSQHNKFGNYNYRTLEDIQEAVKPFLPVGAHLRVVDDIIMVGDRFYVKATAILTYKGAELTGIGWGRESLTKKGMDDAQITGAASSYAGKRACGGLLLLDDTKDADADDKSNSKTTDDQNAAKALGGSVKSHVHTDEIRVMYDQALKSLGGCADFDGLKKVWANYYKTRATFAPDQWVDIEQKYNECKTQLGVIQ